MTSENTIRERLGALLSDLREHDRGNAVVGVQWIIARLEEVERAALASLETSGEVSTEWVVSCGSAGVAPDPVFDNEADALTRYRKEIIIPSYFGTGHRRQASVIKRTIIVEDVTPALSSIPAGGDMCPQNPSGSRER